MDEKSFKDKVSPEFVARLSKLPLSEMVRVIVVLDVGSIEPKSPDQRLTPEERQQKIKRIRQITDQINQSVDPILQSHGGRRIPTVGSATLGTFVAEIPVEGIQALSAAEHVKAILEDQNLFSVK
jgi:hypothetical protein